ncbi:hypothetical protein K439DRAFT_1336996 [Ramaria rubella]|nr:hypothetical protein K439DRAFT_1336996 [Ramaria rubella]
MRQSTAPQYYAYYRTFLQCTSSETLPEAKIRAYCPHSDSLLPDFTVINIFGRLFTPSVGNFLIDTFSMVAFPGNPNNENYKASVIDDTSVKIWGVGIVLNNAEQWKDGCSRIFQLGMSDYVCDNTRHFQLM